MCVKISTGVQLRDDSDNIKTTMELYFKLNKNDDLGLFSQPAINHEECKSNHLSPIPGLGQIHLPLTDGSSVKCDVKKLFCFSFEFNENW